MVINVCRKLHWANQPTRGRRRPRGRRARHRVWECTLWVRLFRLERTTISSCAHQRFFLLASKIFWWAGLFRWERSSSWMTWNQIRVQIPMFWHSIVAMVIIPEDQTRLTPQQWRVGKLKPKVELTLLEVVQWIMATRGLSPNNDEINLIQPNQIASSILTMIELSNCSLDRLEKETHLLWWKCFNIYHWSESLSINAR